MLKHRIVNLALFTVIKRGFANSLRTPIHHLTEPQNDVTLVCWARSVRKHKDIHFVDLSDGLSSSRLQAVIDANLLDSQGLPLTAGCSLRISGDLIESPGRNQKLELVAKQFSVLGECDLSKYPFGPRKKYNVDFERSVLHLRPRLEKYAAIHRVRNKLTYAMHSYFQELDFFHVQTPILTTNDCEGAGETFHVYHADDMKPPEPGSNTPIAPGVNSPEMTAASTVQTAPPPETNASVTPPGPKPTYFPSQCHLTVSSQLHLEAMVHSISRVYTIQTAFRAENALSRKHLCEFAMLEAELVVDNIDNVIDIAEGLIRRAWQEIREMGEFSTLGEKWRDTVDAALADKFARISYDDALKHLEGKKFKHPLKWGDDFKVEHENALLDYNSGRPLVVTHFPKIIKPFYMEQRSGTHGTLAECFDLLLPIGGEAVGGSMRETNHSNLVEAIQNNAVNGLDWYMELREFGTIPHGGFGLGVDRLLQYFTNTHNIKEVVPFPRWQKHCQG